ncbi:MAG: hypothetical protein AAFY31_07765, partial [Pseudomonadota bacterium]
SEFPGLRVAMLGPHRYTLQKPQRGTTDPKFQLPGSKDTGAGPDLPLVWKQTNLVTEFRNVPIMLGSKEDTPQFTGLILATAKAKEAANSFSSDGMKDAAAIARISIPPGGGKGRLLSFFFNTPNPRSSEAGPQTPVSSFV